MHELCEFGRIERPGQHAVGTERLGGAQNVGPAFGFDIAKAQPFLLDPAIFLAPFFLFLPKLLAPFPFVAIPTNHDLL